jgi:hypothetical protein
MLSSAAARFVEMLRILFGLFMLDMDTALEIRDTVLVGYDPPKTHIDDDMRRMATIICASLSTASRNGDHDYLTYPLPSTRLHEDSSAYRTALNDRARHCSCSSPSDWLFTTGKTVLIHRRFARSTITSSLEANIDGN